MKVRCLFCGKGYEPHATNMRMVGPNLEFTCPFCNKKGDRKLNKFAELQVDPELELFRLNRARAMISVAQEIEKVIVDELEKGKKKNVDKSSNV